jgi:hypothetical protein
LDGFLGHGVEFGVESITGRRVVGRSVAWPGLCAAAGAELSDLGLGFLLRRPQGFQIGRGGLDLLLQRRDGILDGHQLLPLLTTGVLRDVVDLDITKGREQLVELRCSVENFDLALFDGRIALFRQFLLHHVQLVHGFGVNGEADFLVTVYGWLARVQKHQVASFHEVKVEMSI